MTLNEAGNIHAREGKGQDGHDYLRQSGYVAAFEDLKAIGSGKVLEIGVQSGEGLFTYCKYLGDSFQIYGVDINPFADAMPWNMNFAQLDAGNPNAFGPYCETNGPFDIIVDDASHTYAQMHNSFEVGWHYLVPGGAYILEDLHTDYIGFGWPTPPGAIIGWLTSLIHEMNSYGYPAHPDPRHTRRPAPRPVEWHLQQCKQIEAVEFYPSSCVVRKKR